MKELTFTRKITSVLFATIVFCLFMPQTAFCQTEKLDIVEYTPPKGWTKTPKEGAVTYSHVNQSRTGLCVITVYASTASAGSAILILQPMPFQRPLNGSARLLVR